MITSKAIAILDSDIANFIKTLDITKGLYNKSTNIIEKWMLWSNINHDDFIPYITDGVTSAYDDFISEYSNLKLVSFRGEYPYHRSLGAICIDTIDELRFGNKLIISDPFAATGCRYPNLDSILEKCDDENIPVFIDRAFAGCSLTNFKANNKCVKYIAYSLSKIFYTGRCRLGFCFKTTSSKITKMNILNEYGYHNNVSILLHEELMKSFNYDFIYNKYRQKQIQLCEEMGLNISDTVFLGYTDSPSFKEFKREGYINRICFSPLWN